MPVWSPFFLVCLVSDKATRKKEKVLGLAAKPWQSHSGCVMDDADFGDAPYSMVQFGHRSS